MLVHKKLTKGEYKTRHGLRRKGVFCEFTDKPIEEYDREGCYRLAQEIILSCFTEIPEMEHINDMYDEKLKETRPEKLKKVRAVDSDFRISLNKKLLKSEKFNKFINLYCGCSDHYLPETIMKALESNNNESTEKKILDLNRYINKLNEQLQHKNNR